MERKSENAMLLSIVNCHWYNASITRSYWYGFDGFVIVGVANSHQL